MEKIDLSKERKLLFTAKTEPAFVDPGENLYLAVNGKGNPGDSQSFQDAMGALYGTAYGMKFAMKEKGMDFKVLPLEGIWSSKILDVKVEDWEWTLQIMVPDTVTQEAFEAARSKAAAKKPNPMFANIRLERDSDGYCSPILHLGPYAPEDATIAVQDKFIERTATGRRGLSQGDLSQQSHPDRPGKTQNDHPPAGGKGIINE
jgi:hypothetical protein